MPDISGIASLYLNWIIGAVIIVAAIILAMLVWRALSGRVRGRRGSRIGISEYYEIDQARRLVLIRRDNVEHLLLIGGNEDVVVETGIRSDEAEAYDQPGLRSSRLEAMPAPDDEHRPIPLRAAPRPAVFGDRKPGLRPVGREEPRLSKKSPESDNIL